MVPHSDAAHACGGTRPRASRSERGSSPPGVYRSMCSEQRSRIAAARAASASCSAACRRVSAASRLSTPSRALLAAESFLRYASEASLRGGIAGAVGLPRLATHSRSAATVLLASLPRAGRLAIVSPSLNADGSLSAEKPRIRDFHRLLPGFRPASCTACQACGGFLLPWWPYRTRLRSFRPKDLLQRTSFHPCARVALRWRPCCAGCEGPVLRAAGPMGSTIPATWRHERMGTVKRS